MKHNCFRIHFCLTAGVLVLPLCSNTVACLLHARFQGLALIIIFIQTALPLTVSHEQVALPFDLAEFELPASEEPHFVVNQYCCSTWLYLIRIGLFPTPFCLVFLTSQQFPFASPVYL